MTISAIYSLDVTVQNKHVIHLPIYIIIFNQYKHHLPVIFFLQSSWFQHLRTGFYCLSNLGKGILFFKADSAMERTLFKPFQMILLQRKDPNYVHPIGVYRAGRCHRRKEKQAQLVNKDVPRALLQKLSLLFKQEVSKEFSYCAIVLIKTVSYLSPSRASDRRG